MSSTSVATFWLKYAQQYFGADALVASKLASTKGSKQPIRPLPGKHTLCRSNGSIAAQHALFLGVVPLREFDYPEIRSFSARGLRIVTEELPGATHVAMTLHGVNFGLDERESFLAQLGGIVDAQRTDLSIQRISIVEKDSRRASRLAKLLNQSLFSIQPSLSDSKGALASITAGAESRIKPHIFVAMPFAKAMEDVYIFGIQGPVNAAGYLCERVDMVTFTGDILERIKSRIDTAALVIADVSGSNPNVYLEIGYAWGRDRPTLLLAREGEEPKFDVRGQRCIMYDTIADLAKKLTVDLSALTTGA